ncbi:MAG: phosphoglycerate mutase, partial [archaeon]
TDSAGHDNKPIEKKEMIELIDKKLFTFLRKFCGKEKVKVLVTADHSTPCKFKQHSAHPVPLLFCDWHGRGNKTFSEKDAKNGKLGELLGRDVMRLIHS